MPGTLPWKDITVRSTTNGRTWVAEPNTPDDVPAVQTGNWFWNSHHERLESYSAVTPRSPSDAWGLRRSFSTDGARNWSAPELVGPVVLSGPWNKTVPQMLEVFGVTSLADGTLLAFSTINKPPCPSTPADASAQQCNWTTVDPRCGSLTCFVDVYEHHDPTPFNVRLLSQSATHRRSLLNLPLRNRWSTRPLTWSVDSMCSFSMLQSS